MLKKLGKNGGESLKVDEHHSVVVFELEAYPEPKVLSQKNLLGISKGGMTIQALADHTGMSWSLVQERLSPRRAWDPKQKRFVSEEIGPKRHL